MPPKKEDKPPHSPPQPRPATNRRRLWWRRDNGPAASPRTIQTAVEGSENDIRRNGNGTEHTTINIPPGQTTGPNGTNPIHSTNTYHQGGEWTRRAVTSQRTPDGNVASTSHVVGASSGAAPVMTPIERGRWARWLGRDGSAQNNDQQDQGTSRR